MGHRLHPLTTAVAAACLVSGTGFSASAETLTELSEILVSAERPEVFPSSSLVTGRELETARVGTSDTARLLLQVPGVSLYGAGGVSSLPALHGLAEIAGHLIEGLVLAGQDIEVRLMLASLAEVLADHLLDRVMDLIGIFLHVLQELAENFVIRLPAAMEHGENIVH